MWNWVGSAKNAKKLTGKQSKGQAVLKHGRDRGGRWEREQEREGELIRGWACDLGSEQELVQSQSGKWEGFGANF